MKSKLSTAKKSPKPQHFHEFSPKTIRQFFSGKSKLNFRTKNEDFKQCVLHSSASACCCCQLAFSGFFLAWIGIAMGQQQRSNPTIEWFLAYWKVALLYNGISQWLSGGYGMKSTTFSRTNGARNPAIAPRAMTMTTPSSHELSRCQSIIQELDSYTWSHGRRQWQTCMKHAWFIKRLLLPWDNFRALIIKPGRCTRAFIRGPNDSHDTLVGNFVLMISFYFFFYFYFSFSPEELSLFPCRTTTAAQCLKIT